MFCVLNKGAMIDACILKGEKMKKRFNATRESPKTVYLDQMTIDVKDLLIQC